MKSDAPLQIWDLWYPKAAATGVFFARGCLDITRVLLVHSPPPVLTVEVRCEDRTRLAYAQDLPQTADLPIARLTIYGENLMREGLWPTEGDIDQNIILPGGEIGGLISWWNSQDGSQWRWQVKFYNRR
jgi:hypothetical protein